MEGKIIVGHKSNPITFIKRSEIDSYLTPEFYKQYQIFERFKSGFGLPRGLSWDQQPSFIMDILETFEREHKYMTKQG